MAVYAISGAATGIGAAIAGQLQQRGDRVISIDLRDADICADLATGEGRQQAIDRVRALAPEGLDGLIPCAGLGPSVKSPSLIARVNYFGATVLVEGLADVLVDGAAVAMIASNSAAMAQNSPYTDALLSGDEQAGCELADAADPYSAYAGSKLALCGWMRRQCPELARRNIRINAVAPGIVATPLTDSVMSDPDLGQAMKDFAASVPLGTVAQPQQIADVVLFLLGAGASYMSGSVLFVDGGYDAVLRPDAI